MLSINDDNQAKAKKPVTNTIAKTPTLVYETIGAGIPAGVIVGPESVLTSESRGQKELVESDTLPLKMQPSRAAFESVGFTFGDPVPGDKLFIQATLPLGWKRQGTDHSMWSKIVDEAGNERVSIFYKAAFYDRDAFMNLVRK